MHQNTPCKTWWGTDAPVTKPTGTTPIWVMAAFAFGVSGRIFGFRAYRSSDNIYSKIAALQRQGEAGIRLARGFRDEGDDINPQDQWVNVWIHPVFRVEVDAVYHLWVLFSGGRYWRRTNYLSGGWVTHNNIQLQAGFTSSNAAPWMGGITGTIHANGIDVLFKPDGEY